VYKTVNQTRQFDLNDNDDLAAYDEILNNPRCFVVREIKEKLSEKHFEEGKLISVDERLIMVVTWQERTLL